MKVVFIVVYNKSGNDHFGECSNMDCKEHFFRLSGTFVKKFQYDLKTTSINKIMEMCMEVPDDENVNYLRKEFYSKFDFHDEFVGKKQTCICACFEKRTIKTVVVEFH